MIQGFVTSVFAMAPPPGSQPSLMVQLMPFALMLLIIYFIVLLPQRRQQKKVDEFRASLKVGDRIILTSGIHGQVTRLGEHTVQLQIADKVRTEVARAAVGGYQGQDPVAPPDAGAIKS